MTNGIRSIRVDVRDMVRRAAKAIEKLGAGNLFWDCLGEMPPEFLRRYVGQVAIPFRIINFP